MDSYVPPVAYVVPARVRFQLEGRPLLASWERRTHPEQIRLRRSLERLATTVEPALAAIEGPAAVDLHVGLGPAADLLHQRDLDNYLEPIARELPARVCSYWATKSRSTSSWIMVGRAVRADASQELGWRRAGGASNAASGTAAWKREINRAIAGNAMPAPDGPVELQLVFRVGPVRNWINLWKPAIDSLDPILGRTDEEREFHPRDDRIVRLGLHRIVESKRGYAAGIEVLWRATEAEQIETIAPAAQHAPAVAVPVSPPVSPMPTTAPPPRSTAPAPAVGRSPSVLRFGPQSRSEIDDLAIFVNDDPGYEEWLRSHPTGFVVNAARNPKPNYLKLHRGWCRWVSSPDVRRGGWTTGTYMKACADRVAVLERWARDEVGGALDPGCYCNRS